MNFHDLQAALKLKREQLKSFIEQHGRKDDDPQLTSSAVDHIVQSQREIILSIFKLYELEAFGREVSDWSVFDKLIKRVEKDFSCTTILDFFIPFILPFPFFPPFPYGIRESYLVWVIISSSIKVADCAYQKFLKGERIDNKTCVKTFETELILNWQKMGGRKKEPSFWNKTSWNDHIQEDSSLNDFMEEVKGLWEKRD